MARIISVFISLLLLATAWGQAITKVGGSGTTKIGGSGTTKVTAGSTMAPVPNLIWWKLNEGTGVSITSTVGPNGATTGTWTTLTQTGLGAAQVYNGLSGGSGTYANTLAAVTYSSASVITFSVWLKRNNNAAVQIVAESSADWSANLPSWIVYIDSGNFTVGMQDSGGGTRIESAAIGFGAWIHAAAVIDQAANSGAGDIKIYIGGVLQGTTLSTNTKTIASAFANQFLFIGARSSGIAGYDGALDDVALFSGEKSADQIAALTAAGAY